MELKDQDGRRRSLGSVQVGAQGTGESEMSRSRILLVGNDNPASDKTGSRIRHYVIVVQRSSAHVSKEGGDRAGESRGAEGSGDVCGQGASAFLRKKWGDEGEQR